MLIIADTSVLINFLSIDAMYLLGRHQPPCAITDHVMGEITDRYPEQQLRLNGALEQKHLIESISVEDPDEVELFGRIQGTSKRLGIGESSAIAVAINRGYALAIDDRVAVRGAREIAAGVGSAIEIFGTKDIIVRLIKAGGLSVEQADIFLITWRNEHRFDLKIESFSTLIEPL